MIAEQNDSDAQLTMEIVRTIQNDLSREGFLKSVLPDLLRMIGGESGGVVRQMSGQWSRDMWVGEKTEMPESLVSEALDRGTATISDGWCVTPLTNETTGDLPLSVASASAFVFRITQAEQKAAAESSARRDRIKQAAHLSLIHISEPTRPY